MLISPCAPLQVNIVLDQTRKSRNQQTVFAIAPPSVALVFGGGGGAGAGGFGGHLVHSSGVCAGGAASGWTGPVWPVG